MTLGLDRCSLSQITVDEWSLPDAVDGCQRHGIPAIAPWRHHVAALGVARAARLLGGSGLRVSSLCRGGFFPSATWAGERAAIDDNRAAIDEAAALGAPVLVLVCGPPIGRDLPAARRSILHGVEAIVPRALDVGVRLAIEPIHPMLVAERSAIVTLAEATQLARRFDAAAVGVVVDAYHVFWDPQLAASIADAAGLICGYHVSDWLVPTTDLLAGRGMMGDGVIDLPGMRTMVEQAGYDGPIEIEVISAELRTHDPDEVVGLATERFQTAT